MDVLVTGACGYIGSALIPLLREDDRVDDIVVFDDLSSGSPRALLGTLGDGLAFRRGDVREYGDVESAMRGVDRVIHLAAITGASSTHERRDETFAINYDGTENVLTAAGKLGVDHVVFASSCNVYGRATSTDIDETVDPDPINPYAETKLQSETLLQEYCEEFDMTGTALRMATNFGHSPGIRFNLVVNYFVFRALTDRPLTVYGDGSNWRPFIHVQDAARAYAEAACDPESWDEPVYNVGSMDANYQISEIADIVADEVAPVDVTYLEDEHPGPSYHVNFDRLSQTGFEPSWTLREGVRDLAEKFTTNA
ncbi:NAD(P)-dependent oxidoreductase [Haloarcula hispanica]|uniref:NAD(P)-dependent oxidoreductase n=1 Tax=Haloarcula hispanica TaxID=51589 RepID=A0A482TFP1_HALHI|nr:MULTISPECIES: NAD(P)-dependent oxidoreductase [Haloarcula]KZX49511.1 oxidoreductase [Haloarcula sp. K1]MCJ0620856.1 NAD(P)-dependent oxidoreductase [Haloarcula hispanica]RYJ11215.1 NAD(P)-dependent oxidoreductase [Haloarcula hispanica]